MTDPKLPNGKLTEIPHIVCWQIEGDDRRIYSGMAQAWVDRDSEVVKAYLSALFEIKVAKSEQEILDYYGRVAKDHVGEHANKLVAIGAAVKARRQHSGAMRDCFPAGRGEGGKVEGGDVGKGEATDDHIQS